MKVSTKAFYYLISFVIALMMGVLGFSLFLGQKARLDHYQSFLSFSKAKDQVQKAPLTGLRIEPGLTSSDKTKVIFVSQGDNFVLDLEDLPAGQFETTDLMSLTGSELHFITYQDKRCFHSIQLNNKRLMEGNLTSDEVRPYSFFNSSKFNCTEF